MIGILVNVVLMALFGLSVSLWRTPNIALILAAALSYRLAPAPYGLAVAGGLILVGGVMAAARGSGGSDAPGQEASPSSRVDRVSKASIGRPGDPRPR